jgi:hypothetical protein
MRVAFLIIGLAACVDGPAQAPDTRHVDLPRGAALPLDLADVTSAVSSDPAIATAMLADGGVRLTGVREGDTQVAIEHAGLLTTVAAHVTPPAIVRLAIEPTALTPQVGAMIRIHAYATDTTGAITDVTPYTTWGVEDPTIATLESDGLHGTTAGDTMLHGTVAEATIAVPITVR